jgi:hypothetical protein
MTLIYVPQRLNVQLSASKEHPHGRVVDLQPGWLDTDDEELLSHPVVSRFKPQTPAIAKRLEATRKAEIARDEAIAKANADYAEAMHEINAGANDELAEAAADWDKRHAEAVDKGVVFTEPHPDPAVQNARSITAGPAAPVATSALLQKEPPEESPPTRRVRGRTEDKED